MSVSVVHELTFLLLDLVAGLVSSTHIEMFFVSSLIVVDEDIEPLEKSSCRLMVGVDSLSTFYCPCT